MNTYIVICALVSAAVLTRVARGQQIHWIAEGGTCQRSYDVVRCIHNSHCLPKDGNPSRGYSEFCSFSGITSTLCCLQKNKLEYSSEEEKSQKNFPALNRGSTRKDQETTPRSNNKIRRGYPNYLFNWNVSSVPNNFKNPNPRNYPYWRYNKYIPSYPNKFFLSINFTLGAQRTDFSTPNIPVNSAPSYNVQDSNNKINDDASNRAPGTDNVGTPQTISNTLPTSSNEGLNIQIPFYRPSVENSTSLRRCIQYFRQVPLLKGRHTPVIGGRDARPKEFPHLAVLGYGQPNAIRWLCGGSLISENYVLTAAHCIFTNGLGTVRYVRLGELDLSTTADDAEERDFTVAQTITHPLYNPRFSYHDIALIRLNASVERFNSYIRPICLPTTRFLENATLVVAGWGLTEVGGDPATILQRATLKHVDNARCRRSYARQRRLPNDVQEEIQVCADGGGERRDTCQGDSGGPMQYTNWYYETADFLGFVEVAGITSFGRGCGLTAGVYTRVLPYVRWIESIVFPN
ncbi:Trypsin [Popillia japonica]|uniref:Trypsin n=1 Tax=Popillia japonica TaxID=7064 RepID=A0AAW1JF25_POPJA